MAFGAGGMKSSSIWLRLGSQSKTVCVLSFFVALVDDFVYTYLLIKLAD